MSSDRSLIIIGAGGYGREVLQYAADARNAGWPYRVIGFLDDAEGALGGFDVRASVIGNTSDIERFDGADFIVALGDPMLREAMAVRVSEGGGQLATLVHPTAYVAPSAVVGAGAVLCPFSLVGVDAVVGVNVSVNVYGSVGHDVVVGDHTVVSPYAALLGATSVGRCALLGTHATVTPGIAIGSHSKVAAGSVVTRSSEPGSLLIGNPAKGRVMFASPSSP